jgi:CheY-specific phosphatase CheX
MTPLEQSIADAIVRWTRQVFSTMLAVELGAGETLVEASTPEANDGVVALIGVAGTWTGTGSVSCSPRMACRICSQMLMTESLSVDEEVLDAVAELTNMVIGGVKTELELSLGSLGISIPTAIFGKNFKTKSAVHGQWVVARFQWESEPLEVKMCLARRERATHMLAFVPASASCSLEG